MGQVETLVPTVQHSHVLVSGCFWHSRFNGRNTLHQEEVWTRWTFGPPESCLVRGQGNRWSRLVQNLDSRKMIPSCCSHWVSLPFKRTYSRMFESTPLLTWELSLEGWREPPDGSGGRYGALGMRFAMVKKYDFKSYFGVTLSQSLLQTLLSSSITLHDTIFITGAFCTSS